MPLLADLLNPEPESSLDPSVLSQSLTFAFAMGGTGDDFDRLLNGARVGSSRFRPHSFTRDLYLGEFVNRCLTVRIDTQERPLHRDALLRVIASPPADPRAVPFRHAILAELAERPELQRALEQTFLQIGRLQHLLESPDRGKRYDAIGRRFEILRAIKDTLDGIATAFEGARSGLSRVHELGRTLRASKGYRDLAELLDHEAHAATIDLRLGVAQDGQVRSFQIVRVEENRKNRYGTSTFGRALARLRMLLGGYRVRRAEILGRLANHVFDGVDDAVGALFQLGLHAEFYLASLSLRERAQRAGLSMCVPELIDPERPEGLALTDLFNPLLLLEDRPPVPCDLAVSSRALVIITGPNSGGKTRLLQAVGLAQLLGQSGMFVPARRARLVRREGLFVSLIQETSADQPEGRLGMELLRIRRLFEELSFNSLVIMDELCSGTNPSEGEEIFQLVVSLLAELEPQAFITTHFLKFAARLRDAQPLAGLEFLQVELDAHHDPTYRFVSGVAPTSLAGRTAERLGVTREALEVLVEARKRKRRAASLHPHPSVVEEAPGKVDAED